MFRAHPSDSILNPSLLISSFEWREPVTTLTDLLVAITACYAWYRFYSYKGIRPKNYRLYLMYFLCYALGMTSASIVGHALQAYISPAWKAIGWFMSATAVMGLLHICFDLIREIVKPVIIKTLKILVWVKYFIYLFLIFNPFTYDFLWVRINSSIDLVGLVLPVQIIYYRHSRHPGSLWLIAALCYAIIPGIIYSKQLSLGIWFNYHDISHVMMAIFIFIMYKGLYLLATGREITRDKKQHIP